MSRLIFTISVNSLKEQINRAYEAENCEDEKTEHLSEVNLENLSGKQRREKVCPGERKTSPSKCLLFHAFFRIAYIATTRWMNNKCMFASFQRLILPQTGGWEELTKKRVLWKRGDKIVAKTGAKTL